MKISIKYILLISLLSSTALANSMEQIGANNKYDQNRGIKSVQTHQFKLAKKINNNQIKDISSFKAFEVKEIAVHLDGIEYLDKSLYASYIGKKITAQDLEKLQVKIYKSLVNQDYLLPNIKIAQNEVKKSMLDISIKAASLNEVILLGEDNELIQQYAKKILAANPSRVKYTQKYLALMNKIPGFEVEYKLEETENQTVDLILLTKKTKSETYVGVDNYGINNLGKVQAAIVSQIYSPFGGNDSILIHANSSNHPNRLYEVGFGYSKLLGECGTAMHLFASHSSDNPTKDQSISADNGNNNNAKFALTHHLYLDAHRDLEAQVAVNYRDSKTYILNSSNVSTLDQKLSYYSGEIGLKYLFKDEFKGRNVLTIYFVQGLDGSFNNYSNPNTLPDKHFKLVKFNIYRDQLLTGNFSLFMHAAASYSNSNLPSPEIFTLGGRDFARGYDFGTLNGNRIYAGSLEARYTKAIDGSAILQHVQPYLFVDSGYIGKQSSNTNISRLTSYGGGLRFKLKYDISLGAEIAVPSKENYVIDGNSQEAQAKYGIFINKIFKF